YSSHDRAPGDICPLCLHDALPISSPARGEGLTRKRTCPTKPSSSPSPAASTPASAFPGCASGAGPCTPSSPTPAASMPRNAPTRSEEHTSELQSRENLVCRLLLEK